MQTFAPGAVVLLTDLKHESQIQELSVRQLKIILQKNCITYKGCVEKHELLERVTRLWHSREEDKREWYPLHTHTHTYTYS